jgi:hypothetical protein
VRFIIRPVIAVHVRHAATGICIDDSTIFEDNNVTQRVTANIELLSLTADRRATGIHQLLSASSSVQSLQYISGVNGSPTM